jgi:hypothetical protein
LIIACHALEMIFAAVILMWRAATRTAVTAVGKGS